MIGRGQPNASWFRYYIFNQTKCTFIVLFLYQFLPLAVHAAAAGRGVLVVHLRRREALWENVKFQRLAFRPREVQFKKVSTRESCSLLLDYVQLTRVFLGSNWYCGCRERCESVGQSAPSIYSFGSWLARQRPADSGRQNMWIMPRLMLAASGRRCHRFRRDSWRGRTFKSTSPLSTTLTHNIRIRC